MISSIALTAQRSQFMRQDAIAEESFARLKNGILAFISQTHFERFTMILRSAGFVTSDLIRGQNAVNFAYILYLRGRAEKMNPADLERLIRRWYAMAGLRGRYTGNPETSFDFDIRQIEARGLRAYTDAVIESELPPSAWTGMLPQLMDTSSSTSPYFMAYKAAQVKLGDKGFHLEVLQAIAEAHGLWWGCSQLAFSGPETLSAALRRSTPASGGSESGSEQLLQQPVLEVSQHGRATRMRLTAQRTG